jgi:hypothetical protein
MNLMDGGEDGDLSKSWQLYTIAIIRVIGTASLPQEYSRLLVWPGRVQTLLCSDLYLLVFLNAVAN